MADIEINPSSMARVCSVDGTDPWGPEINQPVI